MKRSKKSEPLGSRSQTDVFKKHAYELYKAIYRIKKNRMLKIKKKKENINK